MANEQRLIDANVMREDWLENGENEYVYDTNAVLDSIDAQPTVDAVEVVHGHWFLTEPEYLNCSVFGNSYYTGIETLSMALDHLEFAGGHKFCPNCGAKMDKNENP